MYVLCTNFIWDSYTFYIFLSNALKFCFSIVFLILDDYDGYPPHNVYMRSSFSNNTNGTISLHKPKRNKSGKKHFFRSCRLL